MRIGLFSIIEAGFMLFGVYYLFLFFCVKYSAKKRIRGSIGEHNPLHTVSVRVFR